MACLKSFFFLVSQVLILCFLSCEKSMLVRNANAENFFRVAETGFVQGQKTQNILEFCFDISQDWKVLNNVNRSYKFLEICLTSAMKFLEFMPYGIMQTLKRIDMEILGMKGFEVKFGDLSPGKVLEKTLKFVSEKRFELWKEKLLIKSI